MKKRKSAALAMAAVMSLSTLAGGALTIQAAPADMVNVPKYVFLLIGDGMSYPQIESTNYYLNALENGTSMGNSDEGTILTKTDDALGFINFPVAGSAQTYDSTSFCPDSASTATSVSTGHKTYSGTINMDETGSVSYETISEKLKEQKGYKIGIISSVNLNHATPAAFYAHQVKRSSYYEIAEELVASDFDFFAGGGLLKPTGAEEDQTDIYELAQEAGYTVIFTQEEAAQVTAETGKVLIIDEHLADSSAMEYELDRTDDMWALTDYVEKGIECLYDESSNGFFMMVEGGKIDWACHANDAASTMADTKAFSDAVDAAVEFYNAHPDETLIIVTGDHETGGMTIGYAGTNYDTFLQNLDNQKISFQKYDDEYVSAYKENGTDFETVLKDIEELFGLVTEESAGTAAEDSVAEDSADEHPTGVTSGKLVMTEYELSKLQAAYEKTMTVVPEDEETELTQQEYELYGSYEPLSVTITHILNNKSGISFTSYSHTGLPVAVFALGCGEEVFEGYYDNTDIYFRLADLTGIE
ncbi:MAG: alkaline phosphatase [Parasporobacterium sp.]|nr:alkaline phosphatase [Parasporobacterium sp.]